MSIRLGVKIVVYFALASAFSLSSTGQQSTPPASSDSATPAQPQNRTPGATTTAQQPSSETDKEKDKKTTPPASQGKVAGSSNDRLFFMLPNVDLNHIHAGLFEALASFKNGLVPRL